MPPTDAPTPSPTPAPRESSSRRDPRWLLILAALLLLARIATQVVESRKPIAEVAAEAQDLVRWRTPTQGAAEAKALAKPVLYDYTADWCPPCQRMKAELFSNPQSAQVLEQMVVPVQVLDRSREDGQNIAVVDSLQRIYRVAAFATLVVAWPDREGYEPSSRDRGAEATLQWIGQPVMKLRPAIANPERP